MKTPSMVSAERILLRKIACRAAVTIIMPNAAEPASLAVPPAGAASAAGPLGLSALAVGRGTDAGRSLRLSDRILPSLIVTMRSA